MNIQSLAWNSLTTILQQKSNSLKGTSEISKLPFAFQSMGTKLTLFSFFITSHNKYSPQNISIKCVFFILSIELISVLFNMIKYLKRHLKLQSCWSAFDEVLQKSVEWADAWLSVRIEPSYDFNENKITLEMMLGICQIVFFVFIGLINAQTEIRTWGNVNATELGRFRAVKIDESITSFCFTYPEVLELFWYVCWLQV